MPKLTAEQRAELERQLQEDDETDDEDYEVEIWNDKGAGGRLPYRKAKKHFQDHFGIDLDPPTDPQNDPSGTKNGNADTSKTNQRPSGRYFGGKGKETE